MNYEFLITERWSIRELKPQEKFFKFVNSHRTMLIVVTSLLIVCGIVLGGAYGTYQHENHVVASNIVHANKAMQHKPVTTAKILQQQNKSGQKASPTYDFSNVESISYQSAKKLPQQAASVVHTGMVYVPNAQIRAAINIGLNNAGLLAGCGTMKPDEKPGQGNYALAGHNNYGYEINNYLFSTLNRVMIGDKIYITDFKNAYIYETYNKTIIDRTQTDVIDDDQAASAPIVTLISCFSTGHDQTPRQRTVVQGRLVDIKPLSEVSF